MLKHNHLRIFRACSKSSTCLKSRICPKSSVRLENLTSNNIFITKRNINHQIHKIDDKQIYPEINVQINEIREYQDKLFQLYKDQYNKSEEVISRLEKLDIKKINKLIEEIDNRQIDYVVNGEKIIQSQGIEPNNQDFKLNNLEKIDNQKKYNLIPGILMGISLLSTFVYVVIIIIDVQYDIKKCFGPEVEKYFVHMLTVSLVVAISTFFLFICAGIFST